MFKRRDQDYFIRFDFTAAVLLLSDYFIYHVVTEATQIGAFDISNHLTIFQKSQKNFYNQ
jgi:hypothetical protein